MNGPFGVVRGAALAGALALLLGACGGGHRTPTPSPQPTAVATGIQGRDRLPATIIASGSQPVAFDFTPDGRVFFTERLLGEVRVAPLPVALTDQELASAPVAAARRDLAMRVGIPESQIQVVSMREKQWPDACLGLPAADEVCAEVVTPGYRLFLHTSNTAGTFIYRTDMGNNARLENINPLAAPGDLFADVDSFQGSECGLLGIAVDPEFATNHFVYVYATQPVPGQTDVGKPRIIRFTEVDDVGTDPTVIVDNLPTTNPKTCAHVSGNLHFGADGYLYVSIGNYEEPETAGDLSVPMGKILRINKSDGRAAPGNPFEGRPNTDQRIFAYGFRNPFDFTFDPETQTIYAGDNGPGNCDELNLVRPGADYGVPRSLPSDNVASCLGLGGVDPIYLFAKQGMKPEQFGSNVAVAGISFLTGNRYAGLGRGVLVCEFNPGKVHLLELSGPDRDQVSKDRVLSDCRYSVRVLDGNIYYSDETGIYELQPKAGAPAATTP